MRFDKLCCVFATCRSELKLLRASTDNAWLQCMTKVSDTIHSKKCRIRMRALSHVALFQIGQVITDF